MGFRFIKDVDHDGFTLAFDPPISRAQRDKILHLLFTEYQLADALKGSVRSERTSRRFNPQLPAVVWEIRLHSWRPHGILPDSLLKKMDRDVGEVLARGLSEHPRLTERNFPDGPSPD